MPQSPEILAPVGDFVMCQAAIHAGADAIYVGMPGFNARGRAPTLEFSEIKKIIDYSHLYGVKVFLAFNVLIFQAEIEDAIYSIHQVATLNPDAFIVQDIGLVHILHTIVPQIPVHASTQMTITSAEAIQMVEDLGIQRYVLAREVSVQEMAKIRTQTSAELEVFVHGALCVAYSGQCLTSERIGGRSANRGQCAQACRLPYKLLVDGKVRELAGKEYLVSPRDLCGLADVPELVKLGIESFKIEGRLKSPEYVAATTRTYKERSQGKLADQELDSRIEELAIFYSRGFFNGWLNGVNHQRLVDGFNSAHVGALIGEVKSAGPEIVINSIAQTKLEPGHGVLFYNRLTKEKIGTQIYSVRQSNGTTTIKVGYDAQSRIRPGLQLFLNSAPIAAKDYQKLWSDRQHLRRVPVTITTSGKVGEPIVISMLDDLGNEVNAIGPILQEAKKSPVSPKLIKRELSALSDTAYSLNNFNYRLQGHLFVHNKELKTLRRELVVKLNAARLARAKIVLRDLPPAPKHYSSEPGTISVLVRSQEQVEALKDLNIDLIYLDFEFGKEYASAVGRVRELGYKVGIATTRILKTQELGHLTLLKRLKPDAALVRNLGALKVLNDSRIPLIGDFSLNITNSYTAAWFLSHGLDRFCPSYDLNKDQLLALLRASGAGTAEVTVHQYMPEFHMEHCVFAAFLSTGTSYRDCGRPCEKHSVGLIDPQGVLHPLKPDAECRNTMYHSIPQASARLIPELQEIGVKSFRIEALAERPEELRSKVATYVDLIKGRLDPDQAVARLGILERYGVSEGQLFKIKGYADRKKPQVANNSRET